MIHFADAQYLLLILLIPFFFGVYAFHKKMRRKQIEKLGDMQLMEKLMPYRSKAKGWVKLTFFSLAWFFFVIGMARPQMGARIKETQRSGAEIMIALDVSNSMLAEDYTPNRLERAKLAISRIVDKLQGDRIGLIVFAGQSFVQLPITTDYVSAKIFLNTINNESVPVQGTALGEAISTAIKSFSTDANMHEGNKAIILITDGENHEDDPVSVAKTAAELGIKVFCIGVGSADGKPIPMGDNGELLKDKDGNIVVTKLDEKTLEQIAMAGQGAYIRASNSEFGLNPIVDELKELESKKYDSVVFEDFDEQYMYFFAIALFFLVLEFLVGSRRVKGRMFAIAVMFALFSSSAFAQTDKKEVRRGNSFFEDEKHAQAEVEYRKGLLKDSLSIAGNYNLANTLVMQNDAAGAEKIYGKIADSIARMENKVDWNLSEKENPTVSSDYYYNLGNSYLHQKKYSEAVEAYKNSLIRNPND
ncbi:MAG: VWA domain-containing protein, partial [Bacteroidia bacterium]|nr:VWA domain-containing protein [Bacteroidia bacterium]